MQRIINIIILIFALLALSAFRANSSDVSFIEKYKIKLPKELLGFSEGFYPGIGSGIEFHKKNENGDLEFFAISDRGPNFPYGESEDKIISFAPDYHPKIVKILLNQKRQSAEVIEFKDMYLNDKPVTGLYNNADNKNELILNSNLEKVEPAFGLDTESISILKNGDLVVGDEYHPSVNIVDFQSGKIKKRYTPEHGLPAIFKHRSFNRGFEALTVTPNGKIYAILEGVLNLSENTKRNSKFIRMVEIDPETDKTRTFAYLFEQDKYTNSSAVKIGDMTALDDDNLLLIEQGKTKEGVFSNAIYKVSLKNATDISKISSAKPLESLSLEEMKEINFLQSSLFINLNKLGWTEKKAEGLTIIDSKTIAITNDNDFGVTGYDIDESSCSYKNQAGCKKVIAKINPDKLETNLWIIKFNNNL